LGDAARTVFLAVNLMLGLFLSLSLNGLADDLDAIQEAVDSEAVALSDLYYAFHKIDGETGRSLERGLLAYTRSIIEDDWPSLAEDRLSVGAEAELKSMAETLLAMERSTETISPSLRRISSDLDAMSDYRLARLHKALPAPPFFLVVVFFGLVVLMICLGVYRPTRALFVLMGFYLSFVGLVVYLCLALSDPFQGGIGVDTAPLEHVLEEMSRNEIDRPVR
jgi:hypothetical protein